MSPELITLAVLAAPAAVIGPVCLAGHLLTRRHDAALAAAFHTEPETAPTGGGEPLPEPEALAKVIAFPTRRTDDTDHAQSA